MILNKIFCSITRDENSGKKSAKFGKVWGNMPKRKANAEAILTGDGLMVVDIDTKNMKEVPKKLRKMLGKPTIETSNGYHYYFKGDVSGIKQTQGLLNKIDIRNDGGLVFSKYWGDDTSISYEEVGEVQTISPKLKDFLIAQSLSKKKETKKHIGQMVEVDGTWSMAKEGEHHSFTLQAMVKDFRNGETYDQVWSKSMLYIDKYLGGNHAWEDKLFEARINDTFTMFGNENFQFKNTGKGLIKHERKTSNSVSTTTKEKKNFSDVEVSEVQLDEKPFDTHNKELIKAFLKQYHLIVTSGKIVLLNEYYDYKGKFCQIQKAVPSVRTEWSDRKITEQKQEEESVTNVKIDIVKYCIEGGALTEAMKRWQSITFEPSGMDTKDTYNLFKGFDVKPVEGDISPFLDVFNIAFGKKGCKDAMDWFASMYQQPANKVLWALVTRGGKGSGKNTFEEMLGKELLRSENYVRTSQKSQLFGRFNAHLGSNLLIVGQELVWGGNHDDDSVIKEMITEGSRSLEAKGVDITTVPNFSRLYLTSNADWVVPASGKDERRFYVIDTKSDVTLNQWGELRAWFANGGKEALMYEMMNRDLSDFSFFKAPKCKALASQLRHSLVGVELFVYKLIEDGTYGEDSQFSHTSAGEFSWSTSDMFKEFIKHNPRDKMTQTRFSLELKKLLLGDVKKKHGYIHYAPKLRFDCAEHFTNITGVNIEKVDELWVHQKSS